jgi:methylated-DNA-[protein]-cysteine S-methyltransferase
MLQFLDVAIPGGPVLLLTASPAGLHSIEFVAAQKSGGEHDPGDPLLLETARQLRAYFAGELQRFDLPLDLDGTPFQKRVWKELETIPFGETRSYAAIAEAIGSPLAVRAVGAANGANPAPIVVPCHRVIGSGGKLVGYGGGLELKKRLLALEGIRLNMDLFRH